MDARAYDLSTRRWQYFAVYFKTWTRSLRLYVCLSYYYFLSYLLCFSKLLFGNASLLEAKLKGKNNVRCWALIVKNTTWCCQNKPSQSSELQCCGCQKRGFKFLCMFSVAASINECHVLKKKKTSLNVLF